MNNTAVKIQNKFGDSSNRNKVSTSSTRTNRIAVFTIFSLAFIFLVFWNTCYVWTLIYHLHMNDFGKFYYSTVDFLNGQDMYGPNPATFIQLTDDHGQNLWNLNPPHFHLLLLPLSVLSESLSLFLWNIVNFAALFLVLHWTQQELLLTPSTNQKRLLTIGFLAFTGTGAHLVTGQLSFLLLIPVTLAWIHARKNQWGKTGIYLGLACSMKLFFLIFIPYLILQRQFKALTGFMGVILGSLGIGYAIFGGTSYMSWIDRLSEVDWHWIGMNASLWGALARTVLENPTYETLFHAEFALYPLWGFFSACFASIAYYISFSDNSSRSIDRSFAILISSAILISPLGWTYYLFLMLGPLSALISQWYNQFRLTVSQQSSTLQRIQALLLLGSIPGFLVPLYSMPNLYSTALGTITIGSAYFWSTLMLWAFLVVNWKLDNPQWTSIRHLIPYTYSDLSNTFRHYPSLHNKRVN